MYGNNYSMFLINPFIYPTDAWTNLKSITFDGIDERVDCGLIPDSLFNFSKKVSFSFYFRASALGVQEFMLGYYDGGNRFSYFRKLANNSLYWTNRGDGNLQWDSASYIIADTDWHHVVGSFDSETSVIDNFNFYVDGVLISSQSKTNNYGSCTNITFHLGTVSLAPTLYYLGNLDNVALFDYGLSSDDVAEIYNNGTPIDIMNASFTPPVHYWDFENDTLPTITDKGSLGDKDGTMINMQQINFSDDTP